MNKKEEKQNFLDVIHPISKVNKTFGQKAADSLTKWSGSWYFITTLILILILWVGLNIFAIEKK
jgi:uncharacterized membrane protein